MVVQTGPTLVLTPTQMALERRTRLLRGGGERGEEGKGVKHLNTGIATTSGRSQFCRETYPSTSREVVLHPANTAALVLALLL